MTLSLPDLTQPREGLRLAQILGYPKSEIIDGLTSQYGLTQAQAEELANTDATGRA